MSKGWQIAIGASAVVLLLGWFTASNLEQGATFQYFQTLDEFRSEGQPGQHARVHGYVAEGSIERDVQSRAVRFQVQQDAPHAGGHADGTLPVVYASLETPDLFKDGAEVVVEGQLVGQGNAAVFHASNVMAKCPSKFQAETGPTPAALN